MSHLLDNKRLIQGFLLVILLGFLFKLTTSSRNSEEARLLDEFWSRYSVHAVPIPDNMEFAGERVPLEDFEVRERVDRELLVNTYFQSATILNMKRSARWFPIFEPILKQYGVPDDFKYLAVIESGLANVVSPSQAAGFWQFIESTGKAYGLRIEEGIDERYDPIRSTHATCRFLLDAKKEFGSWAMAAAAFNMGTSGLRKQVQQQGLSEYYELWLNQETSRYMPRLIATKYIFEHPKSYGYRLSPAQKYAPLPANTLIVDTAIIDLTSFARTLGSNYKVFRSNNPWIRSYSLPAPSPGKPYAFRVPDPGSSVDLPELTDFSSFQMGDSSIVIPETK
ncbi:MAG: lytic transglycosylase domain-containing protein [Sphingomonadales bacterium]|nr:lytic transglycosylase domain-containing protein [Sphingomonadales bacterium]